jgi:hypothetical protein
VTEPPGSPTAARGSGVAGAVAVVVVALLGALLVVQWAAHERAPFDAGADSFSTIEDTVATASLQVCSATVSPDGLASQAIASRTYELAVPPGCAQGPADPARVVVDQFASAADRDAAAQRFESLVRPRGSGVVYTLGNTTVFVQGSSDDEVQDRLDAALRTAGAR